MNNPLEDFLQRTAAEGIHHPTVEIDPDDSLGLDAWGNEWEAVHDNDNNER